MSLPRYSLLLLLAAGLCQCSSAPNLKREVTIGPEEPARVVFHQAKSSKTPRDLTQTLCTDAVVRDRARFYSNPNTDQFTKVLGQENMQLLLDGLATAGFFRSARSQVVPGSSAFLSAEVKGQTYVLSRNVDLSPTERQAFTQSWGAFIEIYNATNAYRSGDNVDQFMKDLEDPKRGIRTEGRIQQQSRRRP